MIDGWSQTLSETLMNPFLQCLMNLRLGRTGPEGKLLADAHLPEMNTAAAGMKKVPDMVASKIRGNAEVVHHGEEMIGSTQAGAITHRRVVLEVKGME